MLLAVSNLLLCQKHGRNDGGLLWDGGDNDCTEHAQGVRLFKSDVKAQVWEGGRVINLQKHLNTQTGDMTCICKKF